MESSNPVFSRSREFRRGGYATFEPGTPSATELQDMYTSPAASATQMGRMTFDDVVVRTALMFGVLLATAAATFVLVQPGQFGIVFIFMIVGLGLGLVNSFKREPSPPLILAYAGAEGVFVGGISRLYESAYSGVVPQAVLGTLGAFTAMLVLYRSGKLRATPKFQRVLVMALVGYLLFGVMHMIGVWLHLWGSVYAGNGVLPLLLSGFGVVLASLFLVLDFDFIEQGVRNGLPERYAWTAAFGLVVTLIWLYLEILRLVSILNRD
ncbi:MAG: Bax inhibitor-1/YccA family protein [Kineosporiaceae bacterium]|jgi:uncharacterized YccA/Bax inhibitor family protein